MVPEASRLRTQLAEQLDTLRQLEVVEAAERLVRGHRRQMLTSALAELRDELTRAERHLAGARGRGNPIGIVLAEEEVYGLLRRTSAAQRDVHDQDRVFRRAHDTYLLQRAQLLEHIDQLRRRLLG